MLMYYLHGGVVNLMALLVAAIKATVGLEVS